MKSLYVYADKKGAGSLVVTLGLMQLLKKRVQKAAFFRPIVLQSDDYDCRFILEHFKLHQSRESSYGFTLQEAEHIIAQHSEEYLYELLIEKYKKLESEYDFVLCEGIYSELFANIVELDINIEIAKNFAAGLVNVINAHNQTKSSLEDSYRLQKESMQKGGVKRIATIFNRVNTPEINELVKLDTMVFAIPENEELAKLGLSDVIENLEIKKLLVSESDYIRKVNKVKVAALGLDNFLAKIEAQDLMIVPGDRSEIVLGLLGAYYSKKYPSISAIVFSNGLEPHPNIQRLIEGLGVISLPLFVVEEDTYTTARKIASIEPKIRLQDKQKISLALGHFAKFVDTNSIEKCIRLTKSDIVTPQMFEYKLFELAKRQKKKIVLPEAHDLRVLQAAEIILNRDIADIVFLARPQEFRRFYEQHGLDLAKAEVVDYTASSFMQRFGEELYKLRRHKGMTLDQALDAVTHVNYFATMMVYMGFADGMVSGATHSTAETVRPALQIIKAKEGVEVVSSIFFMCLPTRVLVFGDCAIVQDPTVSELASIAIESAGNARKFDIEPKVALISYSSGESGHGASVKKVREATELVRQKAPQFAVEGPIQFDAAFDPEVAKRKMPGSKVAGHATVFVFPDLDTGNTTYKAVQRSAGAIAIGPVLQGLKKPVNDLSRGATVKDIVNTIAITAIQAQEK